MATTTATITLLAARMRVEERQLIAAFDARGCQAQLFDLTGLALSLQHPVSDLSAVVVDRAVATAERAVLAALLSASGAVVVNRSATTRLLADRLALLRHLIVAGVRVPRTVVAFGEQAAVDALENIGYPALLRSLAVDPHMPDARIPDRDTAEAVIEHRAMLGRERAVLLERHVEGTRLRLAVVGSELVGVEQADCEQDGQARMLPGDAGRERLRPLAGKVISRLGTGVYAIDVVDAGGELVVVGAGNLVDFRSFTAAGVDVAGQIADFTLNQFEKSGESHA